MPCHTLKRVQTPEPAILAAKICRYATGTNEECSDAPNEELRQAWEYYHTPRAQYPTAPGYATLRSLNQIITYDAYHMAEVYLTQPMQIVAGSQAGSKWMSDDLYDRASSQDKRYHIVEGANHMDLYDGKAYVAEAISVLAPFFEETL